MNIKRKTLTWVLILSSLLFGGCTPQYIRLTDIHNNTETNIPTITPEPTRQITSPTITPTSSDIEVDNEPTVSISPTSGPSGTVVQVVASGFPPNTEIMVGFGPEGSEFNTAAQGITDANGTFGASVPVEMGAEMNVIFAAVVPGERGVNAPEMFLVTDTTAAPTPYMDMWTTFTNPTFGVSLEYPADWQPVPGYGDPENGTERIGAINGFIQINAMDSDSIDDAAAAEAWHKLQPYGSQPVVEAMQVQGQEARLVMPSDDQPDGMQHQAALIIRYPQPVTISGTSYRYLVLWADSPHIRTIAQTIIFLEVTE